MKKINLNIKTIISVLVVMFSVWYIIPKGCSIKENSSKTIKSDTTYVSKKAIIPAIKEKFETVNPKVKDGIIVYDKELIRKYNELKSDNEKLKEFKKLAQLKEYENTYSDKENIVTVKVKNNVTGILNNQKVEIDIKERAIEYKEKIITNTITEKLKPSFIISTGLSAQAGTDLMVNPNNVKPNIGLTIGLKNQNGYELDVNYNTNKSVMISLKKDIITFWDKK